MIFAPRSFEPPGLNALCLLLGHTSSDLTSVSTLRTPHLSLSLPMLLHPSHPIPSPRFPSPLPNFTDHLDHSRPVINLTPSSHTHSITPTLSPSHSLSPSSTPSPTLSLQLPTSNTPAYSNLPASSLAIRTHTASTNALHPCTLYLPRLHFVLPTTYLANPYFVPNLLPNHPFPPYHLQTPSPSHLPNAPALPLPTSTYPINLHLPPEFTRRRPHLPIHAHI